MKLLHAIFCLSLIFLPVTPSFPPNEEQNGTFWCLSCFIMGTNSLLCWQRSYCCQWELCTLNKWEWGHNCLRIMLLRQHNVFYFYIEHYIWRVKTALWRKGIIDCTSQSCLEWCSGSEGKGQMTVEMWREEQKSWAFKAIKQPASFLREQASQRGNGKMSYWKELNVSWTKMKRCYRTSGWSNASVFLPNTGQCLALN